MDHLTDGRLQAYLDAELPGGEAAEVAEHLMACTDCRVRLGELRLAGEAFRRALSDLDEGFDLGDRLASTVATASRSRTPRPFSGFTGSGALWRAAVLVLAVAGAAAAVVPGSPLRELIDRLVSSGSETQRVETVAPATQRGLEPTPAIGSITVTPVDGQVAVHVRRFADGSTVRVRFGPDPSVRAKLLSGLSGARFSVGPGTLFVIGNGSAIAGDILIELPRGLQFATVDVDGKRALVASPDGLHPSGDTGDAAQDEVVLRVGG